ncbi:glycosyltransferase family 4 protein [Chryseolinea lacunae]|uniref:Glycosyltransferase family 4 protein n=1 Tax=Chryseolinea lacunae TaxID=2801331 RepID=A0ABS1KXR2_9BACT|nr:glycosyltransferase family 4 protein [Chryseolinea lacunae]MBL0744241.1 glycosyltransferase family 4 protein [Chryseolinea lacunae]
MKRIKIIEAIRQGSIGGGESHVIDVVKHLDKARYEPVVLSFTEGEMIRTLNDMGVKTVVIPTTKPFDFRMWPKVKSFFQQEQPDVVHAHGTRAMSNVFTSARALKIPLIYTIHGWSFHDNQKPLVQRVRVWSEGFLARRADVNISVSHSNQQTGKDKIKDFESVVVKNGVDFAKFSRNTSAEDLRAQLNIPAGNVVIGFIARFTYQKSPVLMLEAFAALAKDQPNLTLLMVGDGELMPEVKASIQTLGIADKVVLTGFRKDVPALLHVIDIFCLPSLWEGLPLGLLEAMAMQKAVVATAVDGSKEIIVHGENGLLTTPGNRDELQHALARAAADEGLRKKMALSAFQYVTAHHSVQTMVTQIENIYDSFNGKTR